MLSATLVGGCSACPFQEDNLHGKAGYARSTHSPLEITTGNICQNWSKSGAIESQASKATRAIISPLASLPRPPGGQCVGQSCSNEPSIVAGPTSTIALGLPSKENQCITKSAMFQPRWLQARRNLLLCQWLCPSCQSRLQWPTTTRPASSIAPSKKSSPSEPNPSPPPPSNEDFTPKPLSRPLGQLNPPKPGENSGIDHRTYRQRRDDFFNYDKHLERRKELYAYIISLVSVVSILTFNLSSEHAK